MAKKNPLTNRLSQNSSGDTEEQSPAFIQPVVPSAAVHGEEGVRFGNLRVPYLLFAYDVLLLVFSGHDLKPYWNHLQQSGWVGMRAASSKPGAMKQSCTAIGHCFPLII